MMRFFGIIGIQQALYLTGIMLTCVALALSFSAHTSTSLAKEIVCVVAAFVMLLLLVVPYLVLSCKGDAIQKARSRIFIEHVLDGRTFLVQPRWYRALERLIVEDGEKWPSAGLLAHKDTA